LDSFQKNVPGVLYIRREIEIVARDLLRYGTLDNDQITELLAT
jgi:hypothetical protein